MRESETSFCEPEKNLNFQIARQRVQSVFNESARHSDSIQKDVQTLVIKQTNESRLCDFLISFSKNQDCETAL